jgi:hypothetical protein
LDIPAFLRRHRRNIGIPLVIAALFLARYNAKYLIPSVIIVAAGELLRIWSAGHLRKEQTLTTGGPYRFMRNPLYLGSFLIAIGFCMIAGSIWIWILVLVYFLFCYIPVIRYEERILREKFPDYRVYADAIPALYPSPRPYPVSTTQFSLYQAIANKEYNAVLGIVIVYAYLILLRS